MEPLTLAIILFGLFMLLCFVGTKAVVLKITEAFNALVLPDLKILEHNDSLIKHCNRINIIETKLEELTTPLNNTNRILGKIEKDAQETISLSQRLDTIEKYARVANETISLSNKTHTKLLEEFDKINSKSTTLDNTDVVKLLTTLRNDQKHNNIVASKLVTDLFERIPIRQIRYLSEKVDKLYHLHLRGENTPLPWNKADDEDDYAAGIRLENNNLRPSPGEFVPVQTGGLPIDQVISPLPYEDDIGTAPFATADELMALAKKKMQRRMQLKQKITKKPRGYKFAVGEPIAKPTSKYNMAIPLGKKTDPTTHHENGRRRHTTAADRKEIKRRLTEGQSPTFIRDEMGFGKSTWSRIFKPFEKLSFNNR